MAICVAAPVTHNDVVFHVLLRELCLEGEVEFEQAVELSPAPNVLSSGANLKHS